MIMMPMTVMEVDAPYGGSDDDDNMGNFQSVSRVSSRICFVFDDFDLYVCL